MTTITTDTPAAADTAETARTTELAERLFGSLLGGVELLTVELGRRLGLYRVLLDAGPSTVRDLAAAAGIAERYAREWLEQQAAAGLLDVAVDGDAATRRYVLPAAHVPVLLDADSPAHLVGAAMILEGVALALPAVADAFRSGGGVPFEAYGAEVRDGIAALNRPVFAHEVAAWIAELPDIAARLDDGGVVLDAGCGVGWSTIALARAFPRARVVGVDLDAASIVEARRNAAAAGVGDRTWFLEADAADEAALRSRLEEDYSLVTVFEALHDMGDPVGALAAFHGVLAPGGAVLVADERVGDEFSAPAGEVERLCYAMSVVHCVPSTMAESTALAHGTVLRSPTLRDWARRAGFDTVAELPIANELWRFTRIGR